MPYHGTPQPPQEEMREYHVRKDNYSAVQGELLQPAMRNLPERADNRLAAGNGRECGAVQQGYGETHLPACALYQKGKDRL